MHTGESEEDAEASRTYCGWPLLVDNSAGSRRITNYCYPFREPTEGLCTPAACWSVWIVLRASMPTRSLVACRSE